mgnify:CR=1 FL=1
MKNKKLLVGLFTILSPIIFTGCDKEKKLICSQEEPSSTAELSYSFKNDKLNKFEMKYTLNFEEVNDVQFQTSQETDYCEKTKGIVNDSYKTCKQEVKGRKLIVKSTVDLNKYTELNDKTLDEIKAKYKNENYDCVVK